MGMIDLFLSVVVAASLALNVFVTYRYLHALPRPVASGSSLLAKWDAGIKRLATARAAAGQAVAILKPDDLVPRATFQPYVDVYAIDTLINALCTSAAGSNEPGGWILNRRRARKVILKWVYGLQWRHMVDSPSLRSMLDE